MWLLEIISIHCWCVLLILLPAKVSLVAFCYVIFRLEVVDLGKCLDYLLVHSRFSVFFKGRRDRIVPWREISECKSSARAQEWISARLLFGRDRRRSWEIWWMRMVNRNSLYHEVLLCAENKSGTDYAAVAALSTASCKAYALKKR